MIKHPCWPETSVSWTDGRVFVHRVHLHPIQMSHSFLFDLDLSSENLHRFFLDNQQTSNRRSLIYGLRELNQTETRQYCASHQQSPPISDRGSHFTSDYSLRSYRTSCCYLDSNNLWQTDGLRVSVTQDPAEWSELCYSRSDTWPTRIERIVTQHCDALLRRESSSKIVCHVSSVIVVAFCVVLFDKIHLLCTGGGKPTSSINNGPNQDEFSVDIRSDTASQWKPRQYSEVLDIRCKCNCFDSILVAGWERVDGGHSNQIRYTNN